MEPGVERRHRPGRHQSSDTRESGSKFKNPDDSQPATHACFDCNICLDYAMEPVVTLCGHLYCWPCIYQWLRQQSAAPQQCPVCKAALSLTTLVPLYGRGDNDACKDVQAFHENIPSRPNIPITARHVDTTAQQAQRHQSLNAHRRRRPQSNYMVSSSSTTTRLLPPMMLGGAAIAVLPWMLGDEWTGSSYLGSHRPIDGGDSPRSRRQEMRDKTYLHRISVFFFCCLVLCLLVF